MGAFRPTVLAACVLLVAGPASGDVVGPPEDIDCPIGSEQSSCHGSEYCAPVRCSDESDCEDGEACQLVDLCVYETRCGGWDSTLYSGIDGRCGPGGACDQGSCTPIRVCTPSGIFGSPDGGCACRVDPAAVPRRALGWGLLLAASALALTFALRRR